MKGPKAPMRNYLRDDWQFASSAPGAVAELADLSAAAACWLPTTIPSTAAASLAAHAQWSLDASPRRFDAEDWWFRTTFDAPSLTSGHWILGVDGLATIARVWLNGAEILTSDNMFLAHQCLIEALRPRANELVICCRSLDAALREKRPRPRWRAPMIENQQLRWFRTTVLGRAPGWSPPAAAVGPWQPIWLQPADTVRVERARVSAQLVGTAGICDAFIQIANMNDSAHCGLELSHAGQVHAVDLLRASEHEWQGRIDIATPALWWPHTHGEASLYEATLLIHESAGAPAQRFALGSVGFRSLELETTAGEFRLRINGEPIFCRGACWVPLDTAKLHSSTDHYGSVLERVRDSGMNMLRVGGTMVYEADAFYAICARLGILVWQDLMFANMDYPAADQRFAASVDAELRHQVARIAQHASIALICGNSEVEQQAAMWGAPRELWAPALFHETIPSLLKSIAPSIPYWPSSAHGGSFPHEASRGSTSYYGVGAYLRPLEDARRSEVKFASECLGFANVPEERTLAAIPGLESAARVHQPAWKARVPRDLGAGWDFDDVRDHYLERVFGLDPLALRYADHDRYLELSRLVSAEVMQSTFGEWRRQRSACHGALIWFLRDLWPGAGWGIIGADDVPKAPFYWLRRILQPVALHFSDEGNDGLALHIANERAHDWRGSIDIAVYRHGETVVTHARREIEFTRRAPQELRIAEWLQGFSDLTYAYRFGPPGHDLVTATLSADWLAAPLLAVYFPHGPPAARTADIGLSVTAERSPDGSYVLTVTTRAFAYAVHVDVPGFELDDQYFHLPPGAARALTATPHSQAATRPLRGNARAANSIASASIRVTT